MNIVVSTRTQISTDDFLEAASCGNVPVVQAYIDSGANRNVQDKGDNTALHWASLNGSTECVELLIQAGADFNVQQQYGWTALHLASWHDNTGCVKLLVDAGADLNIRTTKDWSEWNGSKAGSRAIDIVRERGHTEIVELLESTFTTIIQSLLRMYLKRKNYLEILSLKPDGSGYLEVKAEFESLASR